MKTFQEHVDDGLEQARVLAVETVMLQKSGRVGTRRWGMVMQMLKDLGIKAEYLTSGNLKAINRWAKRRALKRWLLCR